MATQTQMAVHTEMGMDRHAGAAIQATEGSNSRSLSPLFGMMCRLQLVLIKSSVLMSSCLAAAAKLCCLFYAINDSKVNACVSIAEAWTILVAMKHLPAVKLCLVRHKHMLSC